MKQYHYFVSYQYRDDKHSGFGQVNLLLQDRVSGPEQIDEITKYIQEKFKLSGVILLNIILLKEEV